MTLHTEIPNLSRKFFCIIDSANVELAAVISSYISTCGEYVPFFACPEATATKVPGDETISDRHEMSRRQAAVFGVLARNAFSRMEGAENVILAGLSPEQKSNLQFNFSDITVIEIQDVSMVESCLGAFFLDKQNIKCRSGDILNGLLIALKEGCRHR